MKLIPYIYKTKNLANNGKFTLAAFVVIFISGVVFIPKFSYNKNNGQMYTTEGRYFKYNDQSEIDGFLKSIRDNNGYLCLGTSESGTLEDGNYYQFLNNDTTLKPQFSVLVGAGRNCEIYIPILLQHKPIVKGMKIMYFINPVYWNDNMGEFIKAYWDRYSSYGMLQNIDWENEINKKYNSDVTIYYSQLNSAEKINQTIEFQLRKYRKRFFSDLRFTLNEKKYEKNFSWSNPDHKNIKQFPKLGEVDPQNIDTVWNISHTFKNKEWFHPIDPQKKYRYEKLTSFIHACKDLGIECSFILGPYNERFIRNYQPEALDGYKNVTANIRDLLIREKVDFIDATDISPKAGTFIDHQHHSSYGAYLIYQKIKSYVHEKEAH